MSEKRKDNKGRILRTGESQRKDLIYQYRYTDIRGKRQTVYSSDLKELREKEKEIQKQLDEGIDYAAGKVTVVALLERYISLKQGVRYNTKVGYNFVLNLVKKEDFGNRQIRDIKVSDAQQWIMKLHDDGKGYSTLTSVRGVVKPAFQMAYNEEHGIVPQTIKKEIRDLIAVTKAVAKEEDKEVDINSLNKQERKELVKKLEKQMQEAVEVLDFELAAQIRDMMLEVKALG